MKNLFLFLLVIGVCSCSEPKLKYGAIASASPEATEAGRIILEKGGNAADAAIAISFALGVSEPAMSGLGGGTQVLISLPGQIPFAINGSSLSPALTPTSIDPDSLNYHKRSTIPSTVKVLEYLYKNHSSGVLTWAELIEPAIQYAENGFKVGKFRHLVYREYETELLKNTFNSSFVLNSEGTMPQEGELVKQAVLAQTLRELAEKGADDFYHGGIADRIDSDMQTNQGWIRKADLKDFEIPGRQEALHLKYKEYDVYSQPPPCGGWVMLYILKQLEGFNKSDLEIGSESRGQILVESLLKAHQLRKDDPVRDFNSYQHHMDKHLHEQTGETTHFSVVDKNGMALSVTSSINAYFGAKAASPGLGFLYNSYADDFELSDSLSPYAIGPNKLAYSSMSPTIIQKNGKTVLVIGSPGSARIISTVAQLSQLFMDNRIDMDSINAFDRIHATNGKAYFEDARFGDNLNSWLESKKIKKAIASDKLIVHGKNPYFGGIHMVGRQKNGWKSSSDPRRDGTSYCK